MEDPPVVLPCKHIICEQCLFHLQDEGKGMDCPKCNKEIPQDFDSSKTKGNMR